MTILNGQFDGKRIVLDDPVPDSVAPQTPVRVIIEDASGAAKSTLDRIAELAVEDPALPRDFSERRARCGTT